jgi:hypothetical protein
MVPAEMNPPHLQKIVHQLLNERFPNEWIGRNGFLARPPRSPDLTELHVFLWRYVKNIMYHGKIADLPTLRRHHITEAVATVTEFMLLNTRCEI